MTDENSYSLCGMGEHCRELRASSANSLGNPLPVTRGEVLKSRQASSAEAITSTADRAVARWRQSPSLDESYIRAKFASAPPTLEDHLLARSLGDAKALIAS